MPSLTDIDTIGQDIRKGDLLLHNGNWVDVIEVKRGSKNAAVTYNLLTTAGQRSNKTTHIPLTEDRRVRREVETAEEKAAKANEMNERFVQDGVETICSWAEIDITAQTAELLGKYGTQVDRALEWYGAEVVALAVKKEYGTYAVNAMTRTEDPLVGGEMLVFFEQLVTRNAMELAKRATSRSTSQWSNLVEDSKREALFKCLDDWSIRSGIAGAKRLGFEAKDRD